MCCPHQPENDTPEPAAFIVTCSRDPPTATDTNLSDCRETGSTALGRTLALCKWLWSPPLPVPPLSSADREQIKGAATDILLWHSRLSSSLALSADCHSRPRWSSSQVTIYFHCFRRNKVHQKESSQKVFGSDSGLHTCLSGLSIDHVPFSGASRHLSRGRLVGEPRPARYSGFQSREPITAAKVWACRLLAVAFLDFSLAQPVSRALPEPLQVYPLPGPDSQDSP